MSNLDPHLDPHLDSPVTLITQPNGSLDLLPRPTTSSLSWPTYASKITPANLPHLVLVMPGKPTVLFSDLIMVILYIRQPWFLMHLVLGEMLAMPSQTGCPFILTLRT